MKFRGAQLASGYTTWPDGCSKLLVEPKLDGYRVSAVISLDGVVTFHCRKPEEPEWAENLGHIREALAAEPGLRGWMIDGELMAETWNETSSLVRRKRALMDEETKRRCRDRLKLHVFDMIDLTRPVEAIKFPRARRETLVVGPSQYARRGDLEGLFAALGAAARRVLRLVPQFEVQNERELFAVYEELVDMEYEGAMAKQPHAPYALDRTSYWMKLKPMVTVEMKITGSVEGAGKHAGRLGAFECEMAGGVKASVGVGFDDAQREDYWARRDELVGAEIEVRVQKGKVATARHAVFVRFREDRNEVTVS